MAQAQPEENPGKEAQENIETKDAMALTVKTNAICSSSSTSGVSFKFIAYAPEFVPRSQTQVPIPASYYYPCFHYIGGSGADAAAGSSDWFFVDDQDRSTCSISNPNPHCSSKNVPADDLRMKIVKQVEYQLMPISLIASTKKIKSLVNGNQFLAQALRSSSKLVISFVSLVFSDSSQTDNTIDLRGSCNYFCSFSCASKVVSADGKKVRRKHPFTEKDREEMQSRTIVIENLPEDHSHQNLDKIFNVVGSVKNIRICHPLESYSSNSKTDFSKRSKLHAFVEFDSAQGAKKDVEKFNDERNWRKGLRVRLLLGLTPKSVLKSRKSDEDDSLVNENSDNTSQPSNTELTEDTSAVDSKRGRGKGQGKGRGRVQNPRLASSPAPNNAVQCEGSSKQMRKSPRMPDGTKGFTMGRGKPLASRVK
ncbi:Peroxidase superfamily protein [Hibiscus syriacus]|uniref:Peroxidase superfamily protein n=1 Tax=Hibiscus syriacus TaxID=106335 RepID=A0A6A3CNN7_HIBSY|nr:Peroxidase superfamily protein [Hibiscus syriacus]